MPALIQIDQELLEIRHGGRLHLPEHAQVGALGTQQPLKLPVERLGVVQQGLEMPLQLLQRAEDPAVHRGRRGLTGQAVQLVEPVGDRFQYGRLQGARRSEHRQRVLDSREGGLAAPGQGVLEVAPLVLLRRAVVLRVVLDDVQQLPAAQLLQRLVQILVVDRGRPAHRAQSRTDLIEPERRLQALVGRSERPQDRPVQVGPVDRSEPEHVRWHPAHVSPPPQPTIGSSAHTQP